MSASSNRRKSSADAARLATQMNTPFVSPNTTRFALPGWTPTIATQTGMSLSQFRKSVMDSALSDSVALFICCMVVRPARVRLQDRLSLSATCCGLACLFLGFEVLTDNPYRACEPSSFNSAIQLHGPHRYPLTSISQT